MDRRAEFAAMMAQGGDMAAAIEVLSDALEMAPDWAAGWFQLGEYHRLADAPAQAIAAWQKAIALDPSDPFGATLKIDLLRDVPVAETMPVAFVELLFDQYAPRFETSLVEKLDYRGPEILMDCLRKAGFFHARRALDLGCGTGLMGQELRRYCDWLEGFDLSQGMLDEADAKGIYDRLEKCNVSALAPAVQSYDLIVAADVFIYVGNLAPVLTWCAQALTPQGQFAFTLEYSDKPFELLESRRFAHSPAYVIQALHEAGFDQIILEDCVLRQDRGRDIRSFSVTASLRAIIPEFVPIQDLPVVA